MFTLPPRPPKDYILRAVPNNQASGPEFSPFTLPRATQTTIRQYCYPVPANDDDPADKSQIEELSDRLLNQNAQVAKAQWIDAPGLNAYHVTEVFNKYSVVVDPDYDARYKHRPRIFQRSYNYELDCLEEARLKKLYAKMAREEAEEAHVQKGTKAQTPEKGMDCCKKVPPFWWKSPEVLEKKVPKMQVGPSSSKASPATYLRWQSNPSIFHGDGPDDPCKRRKAFNKIGLPFHHDACTWYFHNYPPPQIKLRLGNFSQ